jgi:tRNA pseudouridine38-40 synthase
MEVGRRGTVKDVSRARVDREGELVVFSMAANSFLPHQVRNTVGVLLKVGSGKMNTDEVLGIMEARKPGLAGPTVSACGLFLERVNYPVPFEEMS